MDMEMTAALATWGPIAVMLVIFYFLLYKPQKRAQKEREDMLNSLQKGSRIVTIGGIYGTITELNDKIVKLKIANNVVIEMSRGSVGSIVTDDNKGDEDI